MSREIKFRVWMSNTINPNGKMYNPGDEIEIGVGNRKEKGALLINQNGTLMLSDNKREGVNMASARISNNGVTIMQYTGLKDKNGVEIYEGDVLEVCKKKNGLFQVEFKNQYVGGWVLTHPSSKNNYLSLGARSPGELEIKGNIYEHPNLLNPCKLCNGAGKIDVEEGVIGMDGEYEIDFDRIDCPRCNDNN